MGDIHINGGDFFDTTSSQWIPETLNGEPPDMTDSTILMIGIFDFVAKHCAVGLLQNGYHARGTARNLARA